MNTKQEKHLMRHVEKDKIYQDLLDLRQLYEKEFNRILLSLGSEDQYFLQMYVKACVAVEERIVRTAYFLTPTDKK